MPKAAITLLTLLVLLTGSALIADTPIGAKQDKKILAVNFVRLVNTAEMSYRHEQGKYATFADLVKSSELQKVATRFQTFAPVYQQMNSQSASEPIAGLLFGLVVAADGANYKLSIREKQEKPHCSFAFFSDESGLIFEGRVIDCPAQ